MQFANFGSPEILETLNWKDVEKLNPQPLNMCKVKLKPAMLQEGGYHHKFYDNPRARYIYMVCYKYYTYERLIKDFLKPRGIITPEGKLDKELFDSVMRSGVDLLCRIKVA